MARRHDLGGDVKDPAPGLLLANLGSPAAPTPAAVRTYLRQFLSDPRVVEVPRLPWWLILNLFVLPFRPRHSAALYRSIWTAEGSPLLTLSARLTETVRSELARRLGARIPVVLGMRYGKPSIASALRSLRASGCRRLLVLPLYPQYSATTVGSTFDAVVGELASWRWVPELRTVNGYATDPLYIAALAASVREAWERGGPPRRLLLSFHGLPVRYAEKGDPYALQCVATARALADELDLDGDAWSLAYQSRFGREPWLEPATSDRLEELGRTGLESLDVLCPGFAVDCLETLEEIAIRGREAFESEGGRRFRYLPALNDRPDHGRALAELALTNLAGWI